MSSPDFELDTDAAAPLDLLLTQAALGGASGLKMPLATTAAFGRALLSRPRRVVAHAGTWGSELGRVLVGTSTVTPERRDRRFGDVAWQHNPLLRRLAQSYLATSRAAMGIAQDVPLDWRDREKVGFVISSLSEALAPTNNPLTSPAAWKEFIDTGGLSAVRGARNLARDLSTAPRVPSMVDRSAFTVGEDLACTPGAVIYRTPMFELLQYAPVAQQVSVEPVLVVPPTINKFYVLDLAPQRSVIEHLVASGQQVFAISWRNPDARHSKWGVDAYAGAIIEAMTVTREVAAADKLHLLAACSGGILASMTAAHLAQNDGLWVLASLTLLVTVLDQARLGTMGALIDEATAEAAISRARRKGYLDGRSLAEVFAWLRPSDLVWNYWVNNYLLGRPPPAFDILAWNADTTRMPARLYADFIRMAMSNALARPGGATLLNTEVDLRRVTVDSYVVAGVADHICNWRACFRSAQLLGGDTRFILSSSGHIAALVNPPSNPKSSYLAHDDALDASVDPGAWEAAAEQHAGTWWSDYTAWLAERSSGDVAPPQTLGSLRHPVIEAAPGSYVLDA